MRKRMEEFKRKMRRPRRGIGHQWNNLAVSIIVYLRLIVLF